MSIDRIAALLAKAERTEHPAEAEAYLAKAQMLATAASIDLAVARNRASERHAPQEPQSRTVTIGEKGKRANRHLIALFVVVAHANDAHVDVAANSTYVIAYGMPSDLDAIEALFASLAIQMTAAAQHWLNLGTWRSETYVATTTSRHGLRRRVTKPHTAQTARVAFYRSFVERIGERLQEARDQVVDRAVADRKGGEQTAIALRSKAADVKSFHRAHSQARGTWGGYSGSMRRDQGTSGGAGRKAASLARLAEQRGLPGKGAIDG